mmetsp:Transcript_41103/g.97368  ORF Transcript_41103/g.97368 Transcript_41103/m.97368 type:complete len:341 (+) Transcript_41103:286-1308(+)
MAQAATVPGPSKNHAPYRADLLQEPEKQNVHHDTPAVDILKRLFAGGIAGAFAKTVIAPLDRTKIIFQTSDKIFTGRNAMAEMANIVKYEGIKGLWRGNSATVARVIPYAGIQFASFDVYKRALRPQDGGVTSLQRLLAGSAAGATAVAITYPLDLLRARLAVSVQQKQSGSGVWWDAVTGGTGKISLRGLYRGLNPTLLGILPYAGIAFLTRDTLNHMAAKRYDTSSLNTPLAAKMTSGAVAGLVAQSSTYPLDLVRRRMQTEGFVQEKGGGPLVGEALRRRNTSLLYTTIWGTLKIIYAKDGPKGLFKGLSMNWIKGPIAFMISFTAFDYLKLMMEIK